MFLHLHWPLVRVFALVLIVGLAGPNLLALDFPDPSALPPQTDFPDVLTMRSGAKVESRRAWEHRRRPELAADFAHYMYGAMPPKPAGFRAAIDAEYPDALGGKATMKLVSLRLGGEGAPVEHLLVLVPNAAKGRVPVFVGLNFLGNHEVLNDPRIPMPEGWVPANGRKGPDQNRANEADRGKQIDTWAVESTIDRGYALATFYNGDVEPDEAGNTSGIRGWYEKREPGRYDWGAIAAWAWGFHRAIDYLETDRRIDARRIAIVGHSRNGKAALLAGATDRRAALVIPLQAGCGGTAPSRTKVGETVARINQVFPHWFNGPFKQFNEQPERLPFDQQALIAMCAPRPVLLANAQEDTWANPAGQFELLRLAAPVYALYGKGGLESATMPSVNTLSSGRLGYYIRPGKHSMTSGDWKVFLEYADRYFRR